MQRHKSRSPMLRNWDLSFWTPVNFEVEYFINEETEGVLTDTVIYFSDQHLTWLSQLKPNAKVGHTLPLRVVACVFVAGTAQRPESVSGRRGPCPVYRAR